MNASNALPIGIFDSGLGGLSTLREVERVLPGEKLIYFGDTGRVPYGTRSRETITQYALQDARFLSAQNIKCMVVACGTVSAAALDVLRAQFSLPIIGVIEPAVQKAASVTKNGKVAVIATPSTIASNAYAKELQKYPEVRQVTQTACSMFVPLVENGFFAEDDPVPRLVAERYLETVRQSGADTLILGCTHYPLLKPVIHKVLPGVMLVDSGAEAAHCLQALLEKEQLASPENSVGEAKFYVSDTPESFQKLASIFLGGEMHYNVSKISIETY